MALRERLEEKERERERERERGGRGRGKAEERERNSRSRIIRHRCTRYGARCIPEIRIRSGELMEQNRELLPRGGGRRKEAGGGGGADGMREKAR